MLMSLLAAALQVALAFDVASIKRTPLDTGPGADFSAQANGRLHVRNNAVTNLIANAYGVEGYRLVGVPDWIRADRYARVMTKGLRALRHLPGVK